MGLMVIFNEPVVAHFLFLLLFFIRCISNFEHLLWESEREYLTDFLKVEKLFSKGSAYDSISVAQACPTVKKQRQSDLKMKRASKYKRDFKGDIMGLIKNKIDGKAKEIKDEKTEKAL